MNQSPVSTALRNSCITGNEIIGSGEGILRVIAIDRGEDEEDDKDIVFGDATSVKLASCLSLVTVSRNPKESNVSAIKCNT